MLRAWRRSAAGDRHKEANAKFHVQRPGRLAEPVSPFRTIAAPFANASTFAPQY